MEETIMSMAIIKAGMLYFEYNPITHTATRPNNIKEDGMPETIGDYPECIIRRAVANPEHAKTFREAFLRIDAGSEHETFSVQIEMQGKLYWFQYNLVTVSREKVICIAADISELNMEKTMEDLLLRRQFEAICLIDSYQDKYMVRFMRQDTESENEMLDDYNAGCLESAKQYVEQEEQERFMEQSSVATIKKQLETEEVYSFLVNGFDLEGNKQCHKYSYYYPDADDRVILATLEDVTSVTDHDVLTGEYNRSGFIRYVTEFLDKCKDKKDYAILFFNIKGFKAINDLFGVEGGDQILRESVVLLRNSFLKPIAISRLEADHFVLLVNQENLDYDALSNLCHRSFQMKGKVFKIYGRCGVYPLNDHKHDVSGMIDRAKIAKQFIQDEYVKPFAIYNQEMRDSFVKRKELLSALEQALKHQEFEVYYQPVYSTKTEEIVSAEALVRWIHPEQGIIPPKDFIPEFEENGHISQLDMFVEDSVKNFIVSRLKSGKHMIPVAINLSRMDFYDPEFMEKILRDVKAIRKLDEFCRMEITESAYSRLLDHAALYIKSLKAAGVKILLDDFGSGYSSFSTISLFDFDILKLDIGFIRQIGKSKKVEIIIKNIIHMAHDLDVEVIAEGVETREQKEFLLGIDCDYIQGFYYSKPLPKQAFEELLERGGKLV